MKICISLPLKKKKNSKAIANSLTTEEASIQQSF